MNKEISIMTVIRFAGWTIPAVAAMYLMGPEQAEFRTVLLIVAIECLAIGLSSLALWAFTKIDFTDIKMNENIGYIFMGVHICIGLSVLGVYIAQFSN